ncbi:MAG: hypothetical protein RRB13_13045 [bacterium]|nr:hypothetical protein [bacterium]
MNYQVKQLTLSLAAALALWTGPAQAQEFESDFASEFTEAAGAMAPAQSAGPAWTGFLSWEQGGHFGEPSENERQRVLDQTRFRLKTSKSTEVGKLDLKLDFVDDGVLNEAYLDLREGRITTTPFSWMDLSVGKQVNTWGVGDMLFINDLFPKNWMAMFLGKDMEFMKDPANSARVSTYLGPVTFDLVYHPQFAPDTTPNGCVFAVYNPNSLLDASQPALAGNAGACGSPPAASLRDGQYDHDEIAGRLKANLGGFELALYGYHGFYKNPRGMELSVDSSGAMSLAAIYPRLSVQGASLEGQLGPGIMNFEAGNYDSLDDPDGTQALIENGALKGLIGYRMDFSAHFSAGIQVYQETMKEYAAYEQSIVSMYQSMGLSEAMAEAQPGYIYRKEEQHQTYTLRLTFKAQQETLWINFFGYQRPQDRDGFYKLDLTKRASNALSMTFGVNLFEGDVHYQDRDFGMLAAEDNAFLRLTYNY